MRTVSFTQKYSLFEFNGAFPYPFSDYDIYLDYVAGVNSNKSGFNVYQPGYPSPITNFQPASGYIVIKTPGLTFSMVLPNVVKPDVLKFKRRYNIFTYPYSIPLDFSKYGDYIESVLITNANGTGFVSYAPGYSAPFTRFEPGSSYLVVAYGDFDMENPEPSPTPTGTPEPTPNQTPTQTPTTTSQATPTPTPTPGTTPAATPQATSTATPPVTPSMTGSPGATPATTPTRTPTPTGTPVQTSTPTQTRTPANTATAAPTNTPTPTRTATPTTTTTLTMTPTPSVTMTKTPTMTPSNTPTGTPIVTPTRTSTPTTTTTLTRTPTPTTTTTLTMTPTPTVPRLIANITIGTASSNTYNVNLRTVFQGIYGASTVPATAVFTVAGNIGSTSSAVAALDTGVWPAGSTIKLIVPGGSIVAGAGGNGGRVDGYRGGNVRLHTIYPAAAGGPAIQLNYNLIIDNSGIIGGGGGGGRGAWGATLAACAVGGGGGAGIISGAGGIIGGDPYSATTGNAGSITTGGAGITVTELGVIVTSSAGGNLGAQGGGADLYGAAGKCINLNVYAVTWAPQGTTYGVIS